MKRRISKIGMVLTGAALLCAGAFVTAQPAAADGHACARSSCAAEVNFTSKGEYFTVHDYSSDGHSAVGLLWYWNGSEYIPHSYVWNTGGLNGDAVTVNYAIPEGRSVMYIACLGESKTGEIFDCGDASYDTA